MLLQYFKCIIKSNISKQLLNWALDLAISLDFSFISRHFEGARVFILEIDTLFNEPQRIMTISTILKNCASTWDIMNRLRKQPGIEAKS